ncbi:MAG: tetratricopeptide repeat protein, partial [Phycisphaerae bacterium]
MSVNTKVQQGEKLFAVGNIEQAEACFREVLREQPDCAEALNNLGVIAVQRGDAKTAEQQFRRALEAQGDFAPALGNMALIHRHNKHWDLAIDCLERYMAVDGSNPVALNQLGLAYLRVSREADAARILKRSLALNPDQPVVQETLQTLSDLEDSEQKELAASSILRGEGPPAGEEEDDDAPATPIRFGKAVQTTQSAAPSPASHAPRTAAPSEPSPRAAAAADIDDDKLNILFVQDVPCIRNYKTATALRSRGHRVTLCYVRTRLGDIYQGIGDDTYDAVFQLTEPRRLWDVSERFDVIHCHNEPDHYTGMALAGNAPVIHDTHDLISLRHPEDASLAYHEGIANRSADGRVYSTPYQQQEARRLYDVQGPSLVFYNYASQGDLPRRFLPKLSRQDGQVHVVYEGGIGNTAHRDYRELFRDLSDRGIHVHIYPPKQNPAMRELYGQFANVHFHDPVSPRQIIEEMTQYDYGIIPFNLQTGNKRFLDSTIANKLFEYLAAGLPVLTSPLQSYVEYFRRNPVGITFDGADDIVSQLPRLEEIVRTTDFSKQVFTYESEVDRLIDFYRQVIAASPKGNRGKTNTAAGSPGVPVSRLQDTPAGAASGDAPQQKPADVHESLEALLAWLDTNGWDGHDPYDLFNYFIQQHKACTPVPTDRQQSLVNRAAV